MPLRSGSARLPVSQAAVVAALSLKDAARIEVLRGVAPGLVRRGEKWSLRLDGENLSDRRDPIAESEIADASYYRIEARRVWLAIDWKI